MIQEFREFVNRGNVVDLAVAVVLGLAFKPIIDAVVQRVLVPLVGMLVGEPNFSQLGTFACSPDGDPGLGIVVGDQVCAGSIGAVLTETVSFLLVAFALFLVVKAHNRMQRVEETDPEPEADPQDIVLLREIRDRLGSD